MSNYFEAKFTDCFELEYKANGIAKNICIKVNLGGNDYTSIIEDCLFEFNNRKEKLVTGEKRELPIVTSCEYPLHEEIILVSWEDEFGNKLSEKVVVKMNNKEKYN